MSHQQQTAQQQQQQLQSPPLQSQQWQAQQQQQREQQQQRQQQSQQQQNKQQQQQPLAPHEIEQASSSSSPSQPQIQHHPATRSIHHNQLYNTTTSTPPPPPATSQVPRGPPLELLQFGLLNPTGQFSTSPASNQQRPYPIGYIIGKDLHCTAAAYYGEQRQQQQQLYHHHPHQPVAVNCYSSSSGGQPILENGHQPAIGQKATGSSSSSNNNNNNNNSYNQYNHCNGVGGSGFHQRQRNSAVYRHQSFQPFYASIQNNSHNQLLYQQRQMSSSTAAAAAAGGATIEPGPRLIWLLFMHRHGDRAPLNMAPRDKYNNVLYWPEGFGQLNNAGRQRMYKLGKFIRRRYEHFLTDNIREVYSRSSDVDRCIESSHAVLAGLYPPSERFEWNKGLRWIPAPVHTVPAPEDYLLNEAGRKFLIDVINEIRLVQDSDAVKRLYEESVKERELMERELGYEYDMFYKFKCTYSTLDIEERNGLEMPAWYTPELKQKLYRFAGIAFGLAGGGTEKLKKLRCGHLLNDIVSRMELAAIEGHKLREQSDFMQPTNAPTEVDDRRIVHYSTHDSIMAAFLESLNINTPQPVPPGFGATFFIELYVDLDELGQPVSEKYIKLFYMDDTDSENPIEKKLPNCKLNESGQLTVSNFKQYIEHLLANGQINTCNM